MKVKLIGCVAAFTLVGCQDISEDPNQFRTTLVEVSLEETDASLALSGSGRDEKVLVKTAELWCNDELKSELSFDRGQKIEIFSRIEDCKLKLTSFLIKDRRFQIDSAYQEVDGAYYFSHNSGGGVEDQRIVRAWQPIDLALFTGCEADYCDFYRSRVGFKYSVLDFEHVTLENDVYYNKLHVKMEQEPAPTCDDIQVSFVEGDDPYLDPTSVEILLKGCVTTIASANNLEFGLAIRSIPDFRYWKNDFTIEDAQEIVSNLSVYPEQNGNDYRIRLSLSDIMTGLSKSGSSLGTPSVVIALLADFVVAVRNEGGISALVYGIENKCKPPYSQS
ncbi:hypothetical protein [Pseudobacteriovorax antillogorgiicola]|uniref:Lipoprotein n=1 Tax=Pseudobacteriovorax antillogorgiicola TaxID=1513793 RepID=A0A1Y6BAG1_9BACT|nr:hypothetical protein [Pseudobacteriovorax antillogorgiicola]TCS57407.1 hypothetical protein EDD56_103147 [Pseudobacteriovorax antillogorgiicola]SMF01537.1 hypothetical protein SAMN06296036_103186 [Pseudobacteriovorax antillogorgiicola]